MTTRTSPPTTRIVSAATSDSNLWETPKGATVLTRLPAAIMRTGSAKGREPTKQTTLLRTTTTVHLQIPSMGNARSELKEAKTPETQPGTGARESPPRADRPSVAQGPPPMRRLGRRRPHATPRRPKPSRKADERRYAAACYANRGIRRQVSGFLSRPPARVASCLQAGSFLMILRPRRPTPVGPSPRLSRRGAIRAGSGSSHRRDRSLPGRRGPVDATPDRRKRISHLRRTGPPTMTPAPCRAATAPQRPSQNLRFRKHRWTSQGRPAQDNQRQDRTHPRGLLPLRCVKRHRRNAHGYAHHA